MGGYYPHGPLIEPYKHDCDACTFVGWYGDDNVYVCRQPSGFWSLVIRHSSEPSDYTSMSFAKDGPPKPAHAIRDCTRPAKREEQS